VKITEQQYQAFFDDVDFRDISIPSTGEIFQMPLVGRKATQMVSFHTASRSKVIDLLPSSAMVPADLGDGRTIVGVIGIDYFDRNIENYGEVVVVIPVRIGDGVSAPTVEDLTSEELGGATLLVRHLGVTTRSAEVLGNEILGYAKFIADIDFIDMPGERICVFSDNGQQILRFSVGVGDEYGEYERNTLSVVTYKNGLAHRLTYASQTRNTTNAPDRNFLILGDHPLGKILSTLEIDQKPVLTMYSPDFQLISDDRNLEVFKP
jgi:hypothetical protein